MNTTEQLYTNKSKKRNIKLNNITYVQTPFWVLQDKQLDYFQKYLFSFFLGLSLSGNKITVTNDYMAALLCVSSRYIKKTIKYLEDNLYIKKRFVNSHRFIDVLKNVSAPIEYLEDAPIESNEESTQQETYPQEDLPREPQFTGGVNHSSREGGTTVHPYNIDYKLDKNTNTPPYNPSSISEPVDNSTSIRIEHEEEEEKSNSIFSYEQPPKHPSKPIAPKTAISTSPQKSTGASKQLATTNPKPSLPPQPINQSTSIAELLNPRANQLIGAYNLTHEDLMTFEYLWQAYPTKLNRIKCEHAWFGNGYHHQAEQILLKFAEQLDKDRRFKTKKYTPHLINYINGELWHDEIIEEKADKEKGVGGFDHEDTSWIYKKDIFD